MDMLIDIQAKSLKCSDCKITLVDSFERPHVLINIIPNCCRVPQIYTIEIISIIKIAIIGSGNALASLRSYDFMRKISKREFGVNRLLFSRTVDKE